MVGSARAADLVALDDAMEELARLDPRKVQVVEMRFLAASAWRRQPKCTRYRQSTVSKKALSPAVVVDVAAAHGYASRR